MQRLIEVTDLDAAHQVLIDAYGKMRIDATQQASGLRLRSATFGAVRFDHVEMLMSLHASGDPLGSYIFGQVESGRVRYGSEGGFRELAAGDVFLTARPEVPYTAEVTDARVSLAVLDQTVLDRVVQGPVELTGHRAVSPAAADRWHLAYTCLRDEVLPAFAGNRLVESNATRLLAAVTLATFPNTAVVAPTSQDRRDAHPAALRRAVAFIEANADQDISAADIARAGRVTVRAVQLAFRRHLDTTPLSYLRQVRLSCAHGDLCAATPGDTVTAIAARWGYARPSVFAAHYRAAYGVQPSQTLKASFSGW